MSGHYATRRRIARKPHRCEGCTSIQPGPIQPGDVYLEHTEFPGGDAGYADAAGHPVRAAECAGCAARYGREYLLEPIPEHQQVTVMVTADSAYLARKAGKS